MRTKLILIFIILWTISCADKNVKDESVLNLFKKKDKIEVFWDWFSANQTTFHEIDSTNRDEKLDLLLSKVREVEPGLSLELSNEFEGVRDLVISPEGDRDKFQIVKDIVNKAPKINGWTFTAFRQPVKIDFTLEYEDIKFTPSEMFFYPLIHGDTLDLIIYAKNISNKDQDNVAHYGLITMDNVLGEYDCVTKVRSYDFHDLDKEKDKSGLIPLTDLRTYIADFYKNRKSKNGI